MVRPISVRMEGNRFHVDGYPDAVAVKRIDGPLVEGLKSVSLHHADLLQCAEFLQALSVTSSAENDIHARALSIAAIVIYFRCFDQTARRSHLDPATVFGADRDALEVFEYFRSVRNRHIAHDENAYAQASIGLALNKSGSPSKVADILSLPWFVSTSDQRHVAQLERLVQQTTHWVATERDRLHAILAAEYEQRDYDVLRHLPDLTTSFPPPSDVGKRRK